MKSRRTGQTRPWKTVIPQPARSEVGGIILIVVTIWVVFALDMVLPLERFGLIPRRVVGLAGIALMPFLHGNLQHIVSNTVPLVVLLFLLTGSRANSWVIVTLITLLGGTLLWCFGRPVIHIGASGLVFGLITFLFFSGLFEKRFIALLVSILVGFLYGGSLITGIMPGQAGISWDGHLCGAGAGAMIAKLSARK